MKEKTLLFSITKKDLDIQTFRSGGKGGQHQNKRDTGVRIMHRESGAVGEARDSKSQAQNKVNAFRRMVDSKEFKCWHKLKTSELMNKTTVTQLVDEAMTPENLKVEVEGEFGWCVQDAEQK